MTLALPTETDRFAELPHGVRLCYRIDGDPDGPPLVLVAGLSLDLESWPPALVDGLVRHGFRVVRFDNRDVGRSSRMTTRPPGTLRLLVGRARRDGYDLADMARDTVGLLDHLGIERAHLVGMSMGGMIAQTVAARRPERVHTLTSIFSTTGARDVGRPAWSTRLRLATTPPNTRAAFVEHQLAIARHITGDTLKLDEAATARALAAAFDRGGGNNRAGVLRQINAIFAAGDRTPELRRITAPTLVIHGSADRMVHPSGGRATAAAISGARAVTIPGMGHDLPPGAIDTLVELIAGHATGTPATPERAEPMAVLPPGPRWPAPVQAVAMSYFKAAATRRWARRYGPEFTTHVPIWGPAVAVTEPELIRRVFTAPTSEMQSVSPNLDVMFGSGSIFGLTDEAHLRRRRLLTPPFHGKRMRAYEELVAEETRREMATWTPDVEFPVMPSTMRITLNVILRAVFGAEGAELDELRELTPRWVELGSKLFPLTPLHRDLGPWSPWGRHLAYRRRFDELFERLIAKVQADPNFEERQDILSLLLQARYEDGSAMGHREISDELITLLAAGHETTATSLAWAFERLRRNPGVLAELAVDIDAGNTKLLQATIFETQRTRPTIDGTYRRVDVDGFRLGPWMLPKGYHVFVSAAAVHNDPAVYPEPERFDPHRFMARPPDNAAWIPFGGGTRRCLGAAFANMEMNVVLRTVLSAWELVPTDEPGERTTFRGVAYAPSRGGMIRVRPRSGAHPEPS
ncbi:cytochrome P450 [uncultured Mycolicibacterium sp.]|uniref:cytochrome P450 n=1 Tax=uncultured Mycolicibacterium sp. TaxID=2320817 RepID=UPI0026352486|nr:cytochrome P450 [uncultured Mycolicibacterium sp.]